MSGSETRSCATCGAPLRPGQEWCLNCGTAVGDRFAPPAGWRLPVAVVGAVLALSALVLVLVFVDLAGDDEPLARLPVQTATPQAPATTVPPPVTTAPPITEPAPTTPTITTTPTTTNATTTTTTVPTTPTTSEPEPTGTVGEWPEGERAWTVILLSAQDRPPAEARAREAVDAGVEDVGVLQSGEYASLRPGFFVAFAGTYETQAEAQRAAERIGQGAYARFVEPR